MMSKSFFLRQGVTYICCLPPIDFSYDSEQELEEKIKRAEMMADDFLYPQYLRKMKRALERYERSGLPTKFLHGQKVVVDTFGFGNPTKGFYVPLLDTIVLDADAFSIGLGGMSGEFLYGHENGHRIMRFRQQNIEEAMAGVKSILMISDDYLAREVLCDAFGCLLDEDGCSDCDIIGEISQLKKQGLKRIALKLAYC